MEIQTLIRTWNRVAMAERRTFRRRVRRAGKTDRQQCENEITRAIFLTLGKALSKLPNTWNRSYSAM